MLNFFRSKLDTQSITLFKNSSWVFLANFFGAGLALLRAIIIARGLGAEWFGIFTVMIVFIGTIMETLNLNLDSAIIKFGSGYKAEGKPERFVGLIKLFFIASTLVTVLAVTIVYLLIEFKYDVFIKAPDLGWFALLYAVVVSSIFYNQISRGALRLYFKFKINSIVQMAMDIIEFIILAITLFLKPGEFHYFLIAVLVTRFINSVVLNSAAFKELYPEFKNHMKTSLVIIKDEFVSIRKFVFKNSIAKTLQALIKNGDILLITVLTADPVQVALYAVGKKVAYSILIITDPLVTSIYPQLCELYNETKINQIKKMLLRLTIIAAFPSALFFLIALLFNEWIMVTIFGSDFRMAGETFYLLTGASLISAMLFWIQPLLQAINLMTIRIGIYITGIIIGLGFAYYLIPLYGSAGMAITMVIMNTVMPVLFIYFAIDKLNKREKAALQSITAV